MKDSSDRLPPAEDLMKYDMILFSKSRFEKEHDDGSDSQVNTYPSRPYSILRTIFRAELALILYRLQSS